MEKIVEIGGQKVPFKATAGTTRRYRAKFGRDMMKDMQDLTNEYLKSGTLSIEVLEIFENVAYIMAKQADDSITDDPDEWLDNFEIFSIYQVLPEIQTLWNLQQMTLSESKKKLKELLKDQ